MKRLIFQDETIQAFLTDEVPLAETWGRPFMVLSIRKIGSVPAVYVPKPKVYGSADSLPFLRVGTEILAAGFIVGSRLREGAKWGRRTKAAIRMANAFLL